MTIAEFDRPNSACNTDPLFDLAAFAMQRALRWAGHGGATLDADEAFEIRISLGLITVAFALLLSNGTSYAGDSATFSVQCARREVQVITLIEDHGEKQDVSSNKLAEAGLRMLDARTICYEGRVSEAVALYDSIVTDIFLPIGYPAGR